MRIRQRVGRRFPHESDNDVAVQAVQQQDVLRSLGSFGELDGSYMMPVSLLVVVGQQLVGLLLPAVASWHVEREHVHEREHVLEPVLDSDLEPVFEPKLDPDLVPVLQPGLAHWHRPVCQPWLWTCVETELDPELEPPAVVLAERAWRPQLRRNSLCQRLLCWKRHAEEEVANRSSPNSYSRTHILEPGSELGGGRSFRPRRSQLL